MECVGARNFAAMAVCLSASMRSRLRRKKLARMRPSLFVHGIGLHHHDHDHHDHRSRSHCLRAEAKAGAGSESCVVTKEGFANEEDYIKAGGSELVFVQMQQNKSMEMQSKLADKVSMVFSFCFCFHGIWLFLLYA